MGRGHQTVKIPKISHNNDDRVSLRKSEAMNNFFRSATRVIMEDDVQNFIRDLVHTKFRLKDRDWILNSALDGINMYTDMRGIKLDSGAGALDVVTRSELKEIINKNNQHVEKALA